MQKDAFVFKACVLYFWESKKVKSFFFANWIGFISLILIVFFEISFG